MADESIKDETARWVALAGLATRGSDADTTCPSEELLAAFIDGRLSGAPRQQMLAHLNDCPHCYQHWREVTQVLEGDAAGWARYGGHDELADLIDSWSEQSA